jgi:hypothetical protein
MTEGAMASRRDLLDTFWERMPWDGIHSYSDMVERLLGYLTDEQIAEVVASMGDGAEA